MLFLIQMGFEVDETAYFLVCNADREATGFYGEMKFQEASSPIIGALIGLMQSCTI